MVIVVFGWSMSADLTILLLEGVYLQTIKLASVVLFVGKRIMMQVVLIYDLIA